MNMTIEQAREIVSTIPGEFAQSLVSRKHLSEKQEFWLFKLAAEKMNPVATDGIALPADVATAVETCLATASANLKFPKIRLGKVKGQSITLKPRQGVVYISDGERTEWNDRIGDHTFVYYGKIVDNKIVAPRRGCPDWAVELIKEFGENPLESAKTYGRVFGSCCFCGRVLSQADSVERGYGPVCATKYGL